MTRTAQLNRQLADSLAERGDKLRENSFISDAESLYYQSLALRPNNPSLLRKLGDLYTENGDVEAARLCYLGVVPGKANRRFFDATNIDPRVVSAKDSANSTTHQIVKSEQIPLTSPKAHGQPGKYNQFNRKHTDCRGNIVTESSLGEIWFDGLNVLAIDQNRQIISEHAKGNQYLAWRAASLHTPEHINGRVCFLDARSSSIYYHWMLDVLPKVHLLALAGIALDSIDKFIVRASSRFQKDTLQHLGIPHTKLIFQEGGIHYSADELIVPYLKNDLGDRVYTGLGLGLASWVPDYLKQSFLQNHDPLPQRVQKPTKSVGKRLYISRADADSRRIVNEDRIWSILEQFNFEVCRFESMSVSEQALQMADADVVVACHGAGLTNLAFCRENTRVLEIFGEYIVPCYWSLSNLVGLDYHYFMAESATTDETSTYTTPDANNVIERRSKDLMIDEQQFLETLQVLCGQSVGTDAKEAAVN